MIHDKIKSCAGDHVTSPNQDLPRSTGILQQHTEKKDHLIGLDFGLRKLISDSSLVVTV